MRQSRLRGKVFANRLRRHAGQALSHDHVFHTVLGLMDVSTSARDAALDLTAPCRNPGLM